jgi:hypothetical protein
MRALEDFFQAWFRPALIIFAGVETASFLGHLLPLSEEVFFWLILVVSTVVTFRRFEWGVLLLMGELFIGHFGRLFAIDIGSFELTLRMALFAIVFVAWFFQSIAHPSNISSSLFRWTLAALGVIGWGVVRGVLSGYPFMQIFLDANNYLYIFVIFFLLEAAHRQTFFDHLFQIFFAAVVVMSAKTLLLLYIFTHQFSQWKAPLYDWTRRAGIGFIFAPEGLGGFHRVFFEGHIFVVVAFFLILGIFILFWQDRPRERPKAVRTLGMLGGVSLLVILISMSRSFWLGTAGTIMAMMLLMRSFFRWAPRTIAAFCGILLASGLLCLIAITVIVKIPFPTSDITVGVSTVDIFSERTKNLTSEEASASRFLLLKPLIERIRERPFFGSGFGTPVTYETRDPRAIANNPDGRYTTTVFEWGYLDTLTEVGIVGSVILMIFYLLILHSAWVILQRTTSVAPLDRALAIGGGFALLALFVIHVTTPYLNHPLGWGIVAWFAVTFHFILTSARAHEYPA